MGSYWITHIVVKRENRADAEAAYHVVTGKDSNAIRQMEPSIVQIRQAPAHSSLPERAVMWSIYAERSSHQRNLNPN